jgi:molybdopterin/thiamine biosynthesis adenylyltransferase
MRMMETSLPQRINALALNASLADGTSCRSIGMRDVEHLAKDINTSGRRIEIAALREGVVPERYLRNMKSLSPSDQVRLLEATVLIVGLGGLGGLVAETLARMGIGCLCLVDGDVFEAHNLNRQLLSTVDRIGKPKGDAAGDRLKAINPGLEVTVTAEFLSPENARRLVGSCDIAVDCLDNIRSRFLLETAAKRAGIPMVSGAVAGVSGHVTTIFPEDEGLVNIYGPPEHLTQTRGAEVHLGCLAPGVNLIASLESAEVMHVLLKKKGGLRNRLLVADLMDYTFESLQLQ